MRWFAKKKLNLRPSMVAENQKMFDRRCKRIKHLASINMDKASVGGNTPVKSYVVVSYADLLEMWDLSDRMFYDTLLK